MMPISTYQVVTQNSKARMGSGSAGIVDLNPDQMRRLAKVTYHQEVEAIKNINFGSEPELVEYLRDCKSGYDDTLKLMNENNDALVKYQGDTIKEPIAHDIVDYVTYALNYSLQSVRNFSLRLTYLKKVAQHSEQIFLDLEKLDAGNAINVARLAKEAAAYNKSLLLYNRRYQTLTSSKLSQWIKESGTTFEELLVKFQGELGLQGAFNELEAADKLKVYNKIIEASGEGNITMNTIEEASGAIGLGVLALTAGLMVWDLATSHHKVHTAAADGVIIISSVAGSVIGNYARTFMEVLVVGTAFDVAAASWVIPVVGFVVGVIAGYVISKLGNYIIDKIFGSSSSSSSSESSTPPPALPLSTDGHRGYTAEMPDGLSLARQIVHNS